MGSASFSKKNHLSIKCTDPISPIYSWKKSIAKFSRTTVSGLYQRHSMYGSCIKTEHCCNIVRTSANRNNFAQFRLFYVFSYKFRTFPLLVGLWKIDWSICNYSDDYSCLYWAWFPTYAKGRFLYYQKCSKYTDKQNCNFF